LFEIEIVLVDDDDTDPNEIVDDDDGVDNNRAKVTDNTAALDVAEPTTLANSARY